jgi:dTDP-4-dehydrorhamnose 3,5-epimerase
MKFTRAEISDVILIELEVHGDARGYFAETFRKDKLEAFVGHPLNFVQDNESKSGKGVLRGLHYQLSPMAQCKLVRVTQGKILDVVVDIRKNSSTFGKYVSFELSAENYKQILVPAGFAHGFHVLEKGTVISYKVDNYYSPDHERGIAYDDPDLNIDWQIGNDAPLLSEKDKILPLFNNAEFF